jgi:preprotein translocase subunit SecE
MNRQTKRAMAKQEKEKAKPTSSRKPPPPGKDKKRKNFVQFLKEVRLELKKVQWPTRKELIAYTVVVFTAVVVLTTYVFGLDYVFSKAVLKIFGA